MQDSRYIDRTGRYWFVAGLVATLIENPTEENLKAVIEYANDLPPRPDLVEILLRQGDELKVAKITLAGLPNLYDVFNFKKVKIAQEKVEEYLNQKNPTELVTEFIQKELPYRTDYFYLYTLVEKNKAGIHPTLQTEWEEIQKKNILIKEKIQKILTAHPVEILKALFPKYLIDDFVDPLELLKDLVIQRVGSENNPSLNLDEIKQLQGYIANLKDLIDKGFTIFPGLTKNDLAELEKILLTKKDYNELEKWKTAETEAENVKLAEQKALLAQANQNPHKPKPVELSDAELTGTRRRNAESTEDAHAHATINGFSEKPPAEQERILKATYAAEQARVAQLPEAQKAGCTAVTTLTWTVTRDNKKVVKFVTANLADSSAFIFIRNKQTGVISKSQRLNKSLQNFADAVERQRVEALGKIVTVKSGTARVEGIAVARGFGDVNERDNKFMGRVPDISFDEFTLEHDEELIFITGCDGLTEESSLVKFTEIDAIYLANKLHQYDATGAEDKRKLAEFLADEARKDGSTDDITVMTRVYDSNTQDGEAELFCIFDGHGGDFTSKQVGQNFIPTLNQTINPQLERPAENLEREEENNEAPEIKKSSGLVQALKFIGAMILIPVVLVAAYFLAPIIITLIGIKLAAAAAITALMLAVVGTVGLIKSMLSNSNKSKVPVAVVPDEDALEEVADESQRLTNSSVRNLSKIQALKGKPRAPTEMQNMAEPTGSLNADDFTHVESQYVYEKVLNADDNNFQAHYREALAACKAQKADVKYICIDLGNNNKAIVDIRDNQAHLHSKPQDANDAVAILSELGNISYSALNDDAYFEQFHFSNKPRPK